MNQYRNFRFVGSLISPVFAGFVLYMKAMPIGSWELNGSNLPPLTTAGLDLLFIPLTIFLVKPLPPSSGSSFKGKIIKPTTTSKTNSNLQGTSINYHFINFFYFVVDMLKSKEGRDAFKLMMHIIVVQFAAVTGLWIVYTNFMPLGVVMFNMAPTDKDLWYVYIPIIVGFIAGGIVYK